MAAKSPPFLMWYDDNPKLSVTHKIEEAMAAYADRLGVRATLVLVNEADLTDIPGIAVRAVTTVRRNTYWVGQEERALAASIVETPLSPTPAPKAPAAGKGSPRRKARATA